MVQREVHYEWMLAELMARNAMHNTTDLASHLEERGIKLSASQVYRLVTQRPERISLPILSALCDIFQVTPAELIQIHASDAAHQPRAVNDSTRVDGRVRPKRARIVDGR